MTLAPSDARSFLLATWEGGGSVSPIVTVARKLVARGHRVRVISDACNADEALAVGAQFTAWTRAPSRPTRERESDLVQDWRHAGPDGLRQAMDAVWTGRAADYARDVVEALRADPVDLVVASEMLFGVAAACEAQAQPFALLCANVSLFPIPGVPPLGPGLPPAKTEADRRLHEELTQFNIALFDHGLDDVNRARRELGLDPLSCILDQLAGAEVTLIATARAFDFAPPQIPRHIRYVGPQLDAPVWAGTWATPFDAGDERPLVLTSFSTTFQNHAGVLQRVIDAAASLPLRMLVTLGGSIRADELRACDNVRIVDSVAHDAVMREARAVVTHGGHGTVTRALTHRLPMLVMPHGRDQNDNAVRVTERGAGLSLPPDATTEAIGEALRRLLDEPQFAVAASQLGEAVARETDQSPVVGELEAAARARISARAPCPA